MKTLLNIFPKTITLIFLLLMSICSQAQDSTAMAGTGGWYSNTSLWLVGGSITALVIIVLIRRTTGKKDIM